MFFLSLNYCSSSLYFVAECYLYLGFKYYGEKGEEEALLAILTVFAFVLRIPETFGSEDKPV